MKEYQAKIIPLNGDRRLINAVKKAGLYTYNPQGEWNGYGYTRLPMVVEITSLGEMRKFNKIKRELDQKPTAKPKTEEEKMLAWAKRLVKLAPEEYDLNLELALDIAKAKLNYKREEIYKLEDKQDEGYSSKREKLIRKKWRESPLRRIRDEDHAIAILKAHDRHTNTDYDELLNKAHSLEAWGRLEKGTAREYARKNRRER